MMADAKVKTRTKLKPERATRSILKRRRLLQLNSYKAEEKVSPVISIHVVDNTYVYYSRPSRTSNQKKRSQQQAKYLQKQDQNNTKARVRFRKEGLYTRQLQGLSRKKRLVPVISLHVVDNTCVYYSKEHLQVIMIYPKGTRLCACVSVRVCSVQCFGCVCVLSLLIFR